MGCDANLGHIEMNKTAIRELLVHILQDAGIFYLRDTVAESDFVAGVWDIDLADLDIDSLSAMELCIGLEAEWGLTVLPEDLSSLGTLGQLVDRVEKYCEQAV